MITAFAPIQGHCGRLKLADVFYCRLLPHLSYARLIRIDPISTKRNRAVRLFLSSLAIDFDVF